MKLLIAEDDVLFRRLLQQTLAPYHDVITTQDGSEAWAILQQPDAPQLAILDWVMPGMSGPQVCRRVRQLARLNSMYLIILTAKNTVADVVSGLRAGADDYVTKPFRPEELRARVDLGERIMGLKHSIAERSGEANESLARETLLHQLLLSLPCRPGSDTNQEDWPGVEAYLRQDSGTRDSTGEGPSLLYERPNFRLATSPWTPSHER
jgi:sigma-B regulation protein RsbU (phosphoserine phosphatase)